MFSPKFPSDLSTQIFNPAIGLPDPPFNDNSNIYEDSAWVQFFSCNISDSPSFPEGYHELTQKLIPIIPLSSGKTLIDLALENNNLTALNLLLSANPPNSPSELPTSSSSTYLRYIHAIFNIPLIKPTPDRITSFLRLLYNYFGPDFFLTLPTDSLFDHKISVLHLASNLGQVQLVKELIQKGFNYDADKVDSIGTLEFAVRTDAKEVIHLLFSNAIDSDNPPPNPDLQAHRIKKTLFQAVHLGKLDILQVLVHYGADLSVQLPNGGTILHTAAAGNHADIIHFLLSIPKIRLKLLNKRTNKENYSLTAFLVAAKFGSLEALKIFIDRRVDIRQKSNGGINALHHATANNHSKIVNFLLSHPHRKTELLEAKTNQKDRPRTPLLLAAETKALDVMEVLLDHGAKIDQHSAPLNIRLLNLSSDLGLKINTLPLSQDIINRHTATLIKVITSLSKCMAVPEYPLPSRKNALKFIASFGQLKDLIALFKKFNFKETGYLSQLLYEAFSQKNLLNATFLCKIGANPTFLFAQGYVHDQLETLLKNAKDLSSTDTRGNNAFHYALDYPSTCIKNLIYLLNQTKIDPNKRSTSRMTPVLKAIQSGNIPALKIFSSFANVDMSLTIPLPENHSILQTPLEFAVRSKQIAAIKYLCAHFTYLDVLAQYDTFKERIKEIVETNSKSITEQERNQAVELNKSFSQLDHFLRRRYLPFCWVIPEYPVPDMMRYLIYTHFFLINDFYRTTQKSTENSPEQKIRKFFTIFGKLPLNLAIKVAIYSS